jgi:hypothetical protein
MIREKTLRVAKVQPRTLVIVAGLLAAPVCLACGDKLSLVGGGVSFERVSQITPGRIVLLAEPGSPLQAADQDLGLVAEFKRAGHEVRVVTDASELDRVLGQQSADVVVAHWSEAAATAGRLGSGAASPTVIPVAYKADDAAAAKAAGSAKCLTQADERHGRKLSEAIGKTLEKRRKGERTDCALIVAQAD